MGTMRFPLPGCVEIPLIGAAQMLSVSWWGTGVSSAWEKSNFAYQSVIVVGSPGNASQAWYLVCVCVRACACVCKGVFLLPMLPGSLVSLGEEGSLRPLGSKRLSSNILGLSSPWWSHLSFPPVLSVEVNILTRWREDFCLLRPLVFTRLLIGSPCLAYPVLLTGLPFDSGEEWTYLGCLLVSLENKEMPGLGCLLLLGGRPEGTLLLCCAFSPGVPNHSAFLSVYFSEFFFG